VKLLVARAARQQERGLDLAADLRDALLLDRPRFAAQAHHDPLGRRHDGMQALQRDEARRVAHLRRRGEHRDREAARVEALRHRHRFAERRGELQVVVGSVAVGEFFPHLFGVLSGRDEHDDGRRRLHAPSVGTGADNPDIPRNQS